MPVFHCVSDQPTHKLCLCRASFIIIIQKRRIAAKLSKARQFRQNFDLIRPDFLVGFFLQHQLHTSDMGIIQLLLLPIHIGIQVFLQLVRQILQHFFFQAPQNEWTDQPLQPLRGVFVLVLDNRLFQLCPKPLIAVQIPRHEIVKNAPQFTQPVLYRCTRQRKPESGLHLLDCPRRLRSVIFDILRFIDHLAEKMKFLIVCDIPTEQIIGRNQYIHFFPAIQNFLALLNISRYHIRFQRRRKPFQLMLPVINKRRRADDQTASGVLCQ